MKEKKMKPQYGVLSNIAYMHRHAWQSCKGTIYVGWIIVAFEIGIALADLFVAPAILQCVELKKGMDVLLYTILAFTGLRFALTAGQNYFDNYIINYRIEVRTHIIGDLTRKINGMSYEQRINPGVKALFERAHQVTNSNQKAGEHIWTTLQNIETATIGFVLFLLVVVRIDWWLILVIIGTCLISFMISRKTDSWFYEHQEEESAYYKKIYYLWDKMCARDLAKDIRILGMQEWILDIYGSLMKCYGEFYKKGELHRLIGGVADVLFSILRNAVAYVYLVRGVFDQSLSAAEFVLYFSAVTGFSNWVSMILKECNMLHRESLDLSTLREFLNYPEQFRMEGGEPIPKADTYELTLKDVCYRYPEAEKDTIHHVNLTVRPGEKIAIVGLNGAGKTTLVNLLSGFLDPTSGSVLLNGVDIRRFNRPEYYGLFSAVFQNSKVLEISVEENVAASIHDIDEEKVWKCLYKVGLTEKIKELSQGLKTKLGHQVWEDGVLLSGGQNQRLLLARALYKNAPLLLLDEPTAALDPLVESEIYGAYADMAEGRTSFFISHRLASTRFCDRILFVADGNIKEEGTHEELLAKGGAYADLFEVQSRYYKEGREF